MKITNKYFLQKIASFTKLAIETVQDLEREKLQHRKEKAAEEIKEARYEFALLKAADALYRADFITDDVEKRDFLKKASQDPSYLARMLEKVCDAADVASIGQTVRVTKPSKEAEYDPVAARAFGRAGRNSFIVED